MGFVFSLNPGPSHSTARGHTLRILNRDDSERRHVSILGYMTFARGRWQAMGYCDTRCQEAFTYLALPKASGIHVQDLKLIFLCLQLTV